MKIWKKLLALGLACGTLGAGAMLATGCKEQKKELAYYLSEDGTYYIVSGIGTYEGDTLTIPETYNQLPVKGIFDRAFYDCDGLTSVTIPNHITELGYGIFEDCDGLEKAVIGNNVRTLPSAMFAGCKNLFSITLGSNVENIVVNAFDGCTRLVEVYNNSRIPLKAGDEHYGKVAYYAKDVYEDMSAKSRLVTNRDGFVLHSDGTVVSLIAYLGTSSSITMPEKVKVINDYAFDSTSAIQNVTIDKTVEEIGAYAFVDCENLQSVTIGAAVTTVRDGAFYHCDKLTGVTIGEKVQTIGEKAFAESGALASVTLPDNVTELGKEAFLNCAGLKSVTIGGGVSTIEEKTFMGCTKLESATIGSGVVRICPKAFEGCSALKEAKFEKTAVWWVADGPVETSGLLVSEEVMQSAVSAAYYLTGEYKNKYWNWIEGDVEE